MRTLPYISPRLNVERIPDLQDRGLKETAEYYLATPLEECELSSRDFGIIAKKPNYFQKVIPRIFSFHDYQSLDEKELVLDKNKQYVISEILICLNPKASTVMMSHEGELFEVVEVIGPSTLVYKTADSPGAKKLDKSYQKGTSFFSVRPTFHYGFISSQNRPALLEELFEGFYHQLSNPNDVLNLSHILMMAEKEMAVKDGKLMRYGINRPPNTWKE